MAKRTRAHKKLAPFRLGTQTARPPDAVLQEREIALASRSLCQLSYWATHRSAGRHCTVAPRHRVSRRDSLSRYCGGSSCCAHGAWPTGGHDVSSIASLKWKFITQLIPRRRELTAIQQSVATVITSYFHTERGYAWPKYEDLAERTGADRATVARAIKKLHELGIIRRDGGPRGRNNRYVPNWNLIGQSIGGSDNPTEGVISGSAKALPIIIGGSDPQNEIIGGCSEVPPIGCYGQVSTDGQEAGLKSHGSATSQIAQPCDLASRIATRPYNTTSPRSVSVRGESSSPSGLAAPPGGRASATGAPKKCESESSFNGSFGESARVGPGGPKRFNEFWAAYPKREGNQAARTAYDDVVATGVAEEFLVAKAQQYAVAVAHVTDPRWTKYPASWLRKECYAEDPQPPKLKERREPQEACSSKRRKKKAKKQKATTSKRQQSRKVP
jgi:hypothetical protein